MFSNVSTPTRMTATRSLAGLALGAGLCFLLVGCGSSDAPASDTDKTASESSEASGSEEQAPVEDETASKDEGSSAEAGSSSVNVTIDGEALDIADPTTVCQASDGLMTIAVGSVGGTDGIGAVLSEGDSPTVTSVALGSMDGTTMGWAEGAPGEATAKKDGNTYTISGSMMAVDASNPTAPAEKAFNMEVTCP